MVRETGLEPACCHQHTDLNRARLPIPPFPLKVVDGGGFEPPKSATADLQSAPFGHSGTHPFCFGRPGQQKWSWRWDSNPQPADYKSAALPIELRQHAQGVSGAPEGARTLDLQRDRLAF